MSNKMQKKCFPSPSYSNSNPWFVDLNTGIWGKIENGLGKIYGCEGVDEQNLSQYFDVCLCGKNLVFIPGWQDSCCPIIKVYNTDTQEMKKVQLQEKEKTWNSYGNSLFTKGIAIGKYAYMFGCSYPAIVRLDSETGEVNYIEDWVHLIDDNGIEESLNGFFNIRQVVFDGLYLYAACSFINGVIKIDTKTLEYTLNLVECGMNSFFNITKVDENIFAIGCYRGIILWNETGNCVSRKKDGDGIGEYLPIKILPMNNRKIYCFPAKAEKAETIIETMQFTEREFLNIPSNDCVKKIDKYWSDIVVYADRKDEDTLVYVTGADLVWHEINIKTGETKEYCVVYDTTENNYKSIMCDYYRYMEKNRIPLREKEFSVDQFVDYMISL